MLTDDQLNILGNAIVPLFQMLEHEIIVDIANRIRATMAYTRTAELEAQHMYALGYSPAKIRSEAMKILNADADFRKEVAKNTLLHKRFVQKKINQINREAYRTGKELISSATEMSYANDLFMWKKDAKVVNESSYLAQITKAFADQTNSTMKNLTQSAGFKAMSGYESIETVYRKELDKATIKVVSGTYTREKVVSDVVKELSNSGLRTIDYASGYSMQMDTAVKNAVRTGCHQVRLKLTDDRIIRNGTNLVYIYPHDGARNKGTGVANHEEWQGKVYYLKKDKDYSTEAKRIGQPTIDDMWEKTGYSILGDHANDPLGLNGYNCRHSYNEFLEGISPKPKEYVPNTKKYEYNGKEYDAYGITQKQRLMEREVRALRRELEARQKLQMPCTEIKAKIKQKTREYDDMCDRLELRNESNNMRYVKDSSDITKTDAYKDYMKMVHKSEKSEYNNEVNNVGTISNKDILEKEFGKLSADDVVVTNERISHINDHHPEDVELFKQYGKDAVISPDYIIRDDKNVGTVFMVKKLENTNLNVVSRLALETDNTEYKNSVITFYRIRKRNLEKLIEKNKLLYEKE